MDLLTRIGRTLTQEDYKNLFEEGLFVFDTNVLLDLYRLPNEAKEDLFKILESKQLKNRVWLPFQVHLEYVLNKKSEIREQNTKFDVVSDKVDGFQSEIQKLANEIQNEIDKLDLKKRHSSIKAEKYINDELFKASIDKLNKFKEELIELKREQPDIADRDKIGDRIAKIFKGNIGNSFDKKNLEDIYREGEGRYKIQFPPGYKDDKKEGSHFYEDKEYVRKYGDLILWKEIIEKAKNDKTLEYIILISSDLKDDWRGKHNTVRYELLNEIYYTATELKIFHIYDSSNFMKYAKEYLNLEVSDESIQEARDIQKSNSELKDIDLVDFFKLISADYGFNFIVKGGDDIPKISTGMYHMLYDYLTDIYIFDKDKFNFQNPISVYIQRTYKKGTPTVNIQITLTFPDDISHRNYLEYSINKYPGLYEYMGSFLYKTRIDKDDKFLLIIEIVLTP